eukprot:COSAG05_NODE_1302_length_5240_cov_3.393309_1_plen_69_part_00
MKDTEQHLMKKITRSVSMMFTDALLFHTDVLNTNVDIKSSCIAATAATQVGAADATFRGGQQRASRNQ